jgi:hypothetical protein
MALKGENMKTKKSNVIIIFLAILLLFTSQAFAADKPSSDNLKLNISLKSIERNQAGNIKSASVLCRFKNPTKKDVYFCFRECGICFWSVSIDGKDFTPLTAAVHCAPCVFKNKIILKPGKTKDYVLKDIPEYMLSGNPKKLKIRYLLSWKPLAYIYSNELSIK